MILAMLILMMRMKSLVVARVVPLRLYGPGADSGTFDYFTEAVIEESKAIRGDFTASEDDNVLVKGVSGDKGGIAYFGLAYYEENKNLIDLEKLTVSYYQTASERFKNGKMKQSN